MGRPLKHKGSPVHLAGRKLKVGEKARAFRVVGRDLKPAGLGDFKGKIKLVTTFLSLDTSVCDRQVRQFNAMAKESGADIAILGISRDLPFAQKRFCQANAIEEVTLFSDYLSGSFGLNYGLLVKELNLLARAVLIIDKNDVLRYAQVGEELSDPPDYENALEALKSVVKEPSREVQGPAQGGCLPCEGIGSALGPEAIRGRLAEAAGWSLMEGKAITKTFTFDDFTEAVYFIDLLAVMAEEQRHHPDLALRYKRVTVTLTTHAVGGLTENDFALARIIDEIETA